LLRSAGIQHRFATHQAPEESPGSPDEMRPILIIARMYAFADGT
jgi:hypothetical protein